ncbi:MAG: TIGR00269 family protein [Candidatus Nanoarchaeia archaeon]|nr:TIGR00269 family protein [Candidatus Nanoarchaeia archaeon]
MAYEKIENKVKNTIKKYKLFSKKDNVLVACSGGKDSTTLAYILKKLGYNIKAITINPSIKERESSSKNLENLRKFCRENEIMLYEYSFKEEFGRTLLEIRKNINSKGIEMPYCTICGILKRYLLNKKAKELKADKIATGHVLDDEAESVFMNLLRGNVELLSRLGPISGVKKSKKFVPRVKPLYFCKEEEIIIYSKKKKFPVAYERCPYAKSSYREIVRNELISFEKKNKNTKENIIKWFLGILPDIKKEFEKQGEISYCEICGEPSKNKICNACSIITKIR